MSEYRTLGGEPRPPTWSDRARLEIMRERGLEDVFVEPEQAPQGFWVAIVLATTTHLAGTQSSIWPDWEREMAYNGMSLLGEKRFHAYDQVVRVGREDSSNVVPGRGYPQTVSVGARLSAIEHVLDVAADGGDDLDDFVKAVNDRARYFRVGLRLEGRRFIPATSEHVHEGIVRPTLVLLSDERFAEIDALYRKASSQHVQIGPVAWGSDYLGESGFIPAVTCNPTVSGPAFCNPTIERRIEEATNMQLTDVAASHDLWSDLEHDLIDRAPGSRW